MLTVDKVSKCQGVDLITTRCKAKAPAPAPGDISIGPYNINFFKWVILKKYVRILYTYIMVYIYI